MEENKIKDLLKALNYIPKNGTNNIYTKEYPSHDNYCIEIDFNNKKINYGNKIILGNTTTSNFSKPENFVVLECVNRLLEKGYEPQNIELEKIYPSGRGHSGNLDILVHSNDKKSYLMIECKTIGTEHTKEHNKMLKDGGQLFTYYALDRDVKYLCLYSSSLKNGIIEYKNDIVPIEEEWKILTTSKEIHLHWNKSFKDNGIFENHATSYEIKHKALTYEMLADLKESDSGKIFNQIMEILRHNVVSDKPNAFNKLLNLFVCKIIDENRNPTDELKFQWLENDTDETLQMRLNDLYKDGMWRFLNIKVTDYSEDEVNIALQGVEADDNFKQTIKNMLRDTRLKKSPNFAFKEVLDEKSFKANAKIVKEIVTLLQGYKFRYRQKHQFLGDFFELLLNTSMKQEAGQYFTPVPITKFIISSLPIKEFVDNKVKNNDNDILPVAIDYAAGSGHFLTEYMEQVQTIIDNLDTSTAIPSVKNKVKTWVESEKFLWAKDYVYGIDLDDRLVKTAKVSAFFNGDGEANIIWANGLDNFEKSTEYIGKLQRTQPFDKKNNGQFDILISNPPYSVEAFKSTLKDGIDTFELYNNLTDNSSEIECLFVERMKQLLKVGGWAGVVLPVSILSNSGIYSKTREIIFKYFKIKSIVELGSGTFMKTGTNTIILFLERRADSEYKEIEIAINKFFNDTLDVTVDGIENAFSKFVSNVYNDLSFDDYIEFIKGNEVKHELYRDYKKEYDGNIEQIKQIEKQKILYFLLTYKQETVVIKTGKKQEEKNFLGYEFSERRGHEGLKWLPSGTKLYNESNLLDKTKANYYIYNAFNGNKVTVDKNLDKNITYVRMSNLFEYDTSKFDKRVNLSKRFKEVVNTKYKTEKLENVVSTIESGSRPKGGVANITEGIISFGGEHIGNHGELLIENNIKYVPKIFYEKANKGKISAHDILICKDGALTGKVCIIPDDIPFSEAMVNEHIFIIRANPNIIMQKYLFIFLFSSIGQKLLKSNITGQAQGGLNSTNLKNIKIPIPPLTVQRKIVTEIEEVETLYNTAIMSITNYKDKIENIFNENMIISNAPKKKIRTLVNTNPSKAELNSYNKNVLVSFIEMANISNDGYIINKVDRKLSDVRNGSYTYFIENDILLAKITPCMENGKCAIAKGLTNSIGMGSSEFHVLRCSEKINNKYLFTYLNRNAIRKEAEQNMTGASGHRRVPITFYENLDIPLPSMDEQIEIVAEIERYEKNIFDAKNKMLKLETEKKDILNKYL